MKLISKFFGGSLLLAAALHTSGSFAQAVDLKFNPKPGSKYTAKMVTDLDMTMTIQEIPMNTLIKMTFFSTMNAAKAEGGNKVVKVNYDRVIYEGSAMGNDMKYDSDKPGEGNQELKEVASVVNKPFTVTVSEHGKISKVEGLPAAQEEGAGFTAKAAETLMQQSLDVYPGRQVKVGDTWVKNSVMDMSNMKLDSKNTYMLLSVSGGVAKVSVVSELSSGEGAVAEGVELRLSGEQKGEMSMDVATGLILSTEMTQKISGEMSAQGNTIPVEVNGKHSVTGTKG